MAGKSDIDGELIGSAGKRDISDVGKTFKLDFCNTIKILFYFSLEE